ncbi:MAG TPA: FAD-dependent monooxygenase [Polyangiaceae bacterium]|jgi:2-polyprenyl-6-methoxyphenol hydroxylase-like FAD-dependent oxidoreductase|nr:FAD-dependent monooxygenase [Polyangiaceae bacterium]
MARERTETTAIGTVAIIGAGIGGLATALSLRGAGVDVLIVERDPEPIDLSHPGDAFDRWSRPGVPQFRHAHILLARLQTLVRDKHPELHAELLRAGFELSTLREMLPPDQVERFRPMPGDEDLQHFWGRRATFEYVLRQHVGRLPHVRFVHSARVEGLVLDTTERAVRVRGLRIVRGGVEETIAADLVVDASGKRTECPEWLEAAGARIRFERIPSNWQYVCRHYQLKDVHEPLTRQGTGANLDFFGYSTFYAEHGHFSITLGCPMDEKDIARAMRRPEGFDAICEQIPILRTFMHASDVRSKVLGAARFGNRWTFFRERGGKEILGYFAVGDSQMETNPVYGRGCTSAFVQADVLSSVLARTSDSSERSRQYYAETRELLLPHYDFSVRTDHMLQSRSKQSRGIEVPAADRFIRHAFEVAWVPAMNASPIVAREMLKAMEMRELSPFGVRLAVLFSLMWHFFASFFRREKPRDLFAGPPRAEFMAKLPAAHAPAPEEDEPADAAGF